MVIVARQVKSGLLLEYNNVNKKRNNKRVEQEIYGEMSSEYSLTESEEQHISKDVVTSLENLLGSLLK